jgi:hypothetical protein
MGDNDEIFLISHVHKFHETLQGKGVKCRTTIVPGKGHAFDIWEKIGGEMDKMIIGPAVEWVAGFTKEDKQGTELPQVENVKVPNEERMGDYVGEKREAEGLESGGKKGKKNWLGWMRWLRRR